MLRLIEISKDGSCAENRFKVTAQVQAIIDHTLTFYDTINVTSPWASYLGVLEKDVIGVCSFKSSPIENQVEIAYHTFPEYEGRGFASAMVSLLLGVAYAQSPGIRVYARTLVDRNASHRVLEKAGFMPRGVVNDPDDGPVLEWTHFYT